MGLFDIFKSKNDNQQKELTKTLAIDNIYLLTIPSDWTPYESDRFRTINNTKTVNFSITNYGKELDKNNPFTLEELKQETFALFERFVNEGGYEAINDREANNNYVYQAFKVDDEIQYYYYTSREALGQSIRIVFILKETGDYKTSTKNTLLKIGESIMIKVA